MGARVGAIVCPGASLCAGVGRPASTCSLSAWLFVVMGVLRENAVNPGKEQACIMAEGRECVSREKWERPGLTEDM